MKLYKIKAENWSDFFGVPPEAGESYPAGIDGVTIIAQTPNCDAFLFLSEDTQSNSKLELLDTAPEGFDFTYRQDWGLEVNDSVVDRVIEDLS